MLASAEEALLWQGCQGDIGWTDEVEEPAAVEVPWVWDHLRKGGDGEACVQQGSLGSCPCKLYQHAWSREAFPDLGSKILGASTHTRLPTKNNPSQGSSVSRLGSKWSISWDSYWWLHCFRNFISDLYSIKDNLPIVNAYTQNIHSDLLVHFQMLPFPLKLVLKMIMSWCLITDYYYIPIGVFRRMYRTKKGSGTTRRWFSRA